MKKISILVFSLLLFSGCFVLASDSITTKPVIDDKSTVAPEGTVVVLENIKTVTEVKEGDDVQNINRIISDQNNTQSGLMVKPTKDLEKILSENSQKLPDNAYIIEGFFDINVKDLATGEPTGQGVTFAVYLNEISSTTEEIGAIHYSKTKGFEYIKAGSFDKSSKIAVFTLEDTSPVAFVISYKNKTTGDNTPSVPTSNRVVVNTGV